MTKKTKILLSTVIILLILIPVSLIGANFIYLTPKSSETVNFSPITPPTRISYQGKTYQQDSSNLNFGLGVSNDGKMDTEGVKLLKKATDQKAQEQVYSVDGIAADKYMIVNWYRHAQMSSESTATTYSTVNLKNPVKALELLQPVEARLLDTQSDNTKQYLLTESQSKSVIAQVRVLISQPTVKKDLKNAAPVTKIQISNHYFVVEFDLDVVKLGKQIYAETTNGDNLAWKVPTQLWTEITAIRK